MAALILGSGAESSASGVFLRDGGKITNGGSSDVVAQILGATGVLAEGGAATVSNFGKISSFRDTSPGVDLRDGGVVTNGSLLDTHALIIGGRGIDISGATGTVNNFGTISGSSRAGYYGSPQYAGVNLLSGGTLTNGATGDTTALIEGYDGVLLANASVGTNLGSIQATGGYGARLYGAARLTNGANGAAGGFIGGWIGVELYDTATLTNFGVVVGQGGVAVELNGVGTAECGSGLAIPGPDRRGRWPGGFHLWREQRQWHSEQRPGHRRRRR